jgi:hypothetical protein
MSLDSSYCDSNSDTVVILNLSIRHYFTSHFNDEDSLYIHTIWYTVFPNDYFTFINLINMWFHILILYCVTSYFPKNIIYVLGLITVWKENVLHFSTNFQYFIFVTFIFHYIYSEISIKANAYLETEKSIVWLLKIGGVYMTT